MEFQNNIDSLSLHKDSKHCLKELLQQLPCSKLVKSHLNFEGNQLIAGPYRYHLGDFDSLFIISIGKAAAQMAEAATESIKTNYSGHFSGLIITKEGHGQDVEGLECLEASHPLPDESSLLASQKLLEKIDEAKKNKPLFLVLLSGGASALLCLPIEGVGLSDKIQLTDKLLKSGAKIDEINVIRKHLSQVKGGRLAQRLAPHPILNLVISDVIGGDVSSVGSGPTVPDPSTFEEGLKLLKKYKLDQSLPLSLLGVFRKGVKGDLPETPKPDRCFFEQNTVVLSDYITALSSVTEFFKKQEYKVETINEPVTGLNSRAVMVHEAFLVDENLYPKSGSGYCLASAGETTVIVKGEGKGGRNMEFAVSLALRLKEHQVPNFEVVSFGTDGTDGPTDAAGGFMTESMLSTPELIDQAKQSVENNDTYHFLEKVGGLIKTGPTGTNVNDVRFIVLRPKL